MSRKAWAIVALLVTIITVIAVVPGTRSGPVEAVKIGAALPLTGDAAPYGKAAQQAIDLALEQVNAFSSVIIARGKENGNWRW